MGTARRSVGQGSLAKRARGLAALALIVAGATAAAAEEWRLESAGSSYTDVNGDVFAADQAYVPGGYGYSGGAAATFTDPVANTTDDLLYQTVRGGSFSYLFDGLAAGSYTVELHFQEPFRTGPNQRKFDVVVEGMVALNDYDIFAQAGGKNIARIETLAAAVNDGQLRIDFVPVLGVNAIVSAVEVIGDAPAEADIAVAPPAVDFGTVAVGADADAVVTVSNEGTATLTVTGLATTNGVFAVVSPAVPFDVPGGGSVGVTVRFSPVAPGLETGDLEVSSSDADEPTVAVALAGEGDDGSGPAYEQRVNSGGLDYTDGNGDLFAADQAFVPGDWGYTGGGAQTFSTPVGGTDDDLLYQTVRGGSSFGYTFDTIPNGPYEVTLYFQEPFRTGPNQRKFDVSIEGQIGLDDYDIFAQAGGKNIATSETVLVNINDGALNLQFQSVVGGNAIVCAIAVVGGTPGPNAPEIAVDPSSLDFGDVLVGSSTDRVVTVYNEGQQPLTVSSLLSSDPEFSIVSPATPFVVGAYGSQAVTVRYSPAGLGADAADLEIASDDADESVLEVALAGEGVDSVPLEFRLNCGGAAYVDTNGDLFVADQAYVAGSYGYVGGSVVTRTEPVTGDNDPMYQDLRVGTSFSYNFDNLPSGDYEVRLYFVEFTMGGLGLRRFDITVEGVLVRDGFDIFKAGKDLFEAYRETVTTTVTDGQLNVTLTQQTANDASLAAIGVVSAPAPPLAAYADVAADVGITFTHELGIDECLPYQTGFSPTEISSGSAWADYDNDGDVDLYMTSKGGPNRLYRNDGDGPDGDSLPEFTEVAAAAGVDDAGGVSHSAVFIDYDNDGDQDLYVTDWRVDGEPVPGNKLYRNRLIEDGSPTFDDVTASAGVGDFGRGITTAWADYDEDGDLDFYVIKHFTCMPGIDESDDTLWRNDGDGTFTDVTGLLCPGGVAPCPATAGLGFAAGWVDYDNDADLDLYIVNDDIGNLNGANVLWRNNGNGTFTDVSAATETNQSENGMGLAVGDYMNEGLLAFGFSNQSPNNLLRQRGDGSFEDVSAVAGIQRGIIASSGGKQWTWGSVFFDHDADGWLDLLFIGGVLDLGSPADEQQQPNAFFWNNRDGTFTDLSSYSGLDDPGRGRNASLVDFDDDGRVDVFVSNLGQLPLLFHNESEAMGNPNNWLTVTVEGTTSNRDGIGTRLTLTTPDGTTQFRDISTGPTHGGGDQRAAFFGLGASTEGELTVRWPTGVVQVLGTVSSDQKLHLVEP